MNFFVGILGAAVLAGAVIPCFAKLTKNMLLKRQWESGQITKEEWDRERRGFGGISCGSYGKQEGDPSLKPGRADGGIPLSGAPADGGG